MATLILLNKKRVLKVVYFNKIQVLPPIFYSLISILAGFFFWLTEPSFKTFISSSYADVINSRIDGTQFAGSLAIIFWLISFVNYGVIRNLSLKKYTWSNRLFIIITLFGIIWLALHSRRSELIGMILIIMLFYSKNNSKKSLIYLSLAVLFLVIIGEIRTISLYGFFQDGFTEGKVDVKSIPGGVSNVFQTLLTTMDFFGKNDFLYGETYGNYALQILPKFVYSIIGVDIPNYYSQHVLEKYSYNGGTYLLSVAYANFGLFGAFFSGIFIGLYVRLSIVALESNFLFFQVIGLFLIAISMRGFWYELIIIIKPIVIVMLPLAFLFKLVKKQF